jgi:hypothetical protein
VQRGAGTDPASDRLRAVADSPRHLHTDGMICTLFSVRRLNVVLSCRSLGARPVS